MEILCIKTADINEKKVLKHKVYYSKEKPTKDFDCVLLIGNSYSKGAVPLLAECNKATVNEFDKIHPAFTFNKNWVYQWILGVNKVYPPRTNILSYIKPGTSSYYSVINCKEMCYINIRDFKLPLPKFNKGSYEIITEEPSEAI
jgi:hypothetical protein